jgi:hypothetical protein
MKCLICGETSGERILCSKHTGTDTPNRFLTANPCGSFSPRKGAANGVCENFLLCTPIKDALKGKPLINNLGHVTCPHSAINLAQVVYGKYTTDELKGNYSECIK